MPTDIIVALIMGIIAPLLIQLITKQLKKLEEKKKKDIDDAVNAPTLERSLRDELRSESERQRLRALALEDMFDEVAKEKEEALKELSDWQTAFYKVKSDKSKLEWEMSILRQELQTLRGQLLTLQQTREALNGLDDSGR